MRISLTIHNITSADILCNTQISGEYKINCISLLILTSSSTDAIAVALGWTLWPPFTPLACHTPCQVALMELFRNGAERVSVMYSLYHKYIVSSSLPFWCSFEFFHMQSFENIVCHLVLWVFDLWSCTSKVWLKQKETAGARQSQNRSHGWV